MTLDNCWVLIAAAGSGSRMQSSLPKQYMPLAGKPLLQHVLERFLGWSSELQIALVGRIDLSEQSNITAINDARVHSVEGGTSRAESVLNGLRFIAAQTETPVPVLVHDAARPLIRKIDVLNLLENTFAARRDGHAVGGILATPVTETVKLADSDLPGQSGCKNIERTLDREKLWHAKTPQLFMHDELLQAMQNGLAATTATITDEASAMERAGHKVVMVECCSDNIKVTRAGDLPVAEALLALQASRQAEFNKD